MIVLHSFINVLNTDNKPFMYILSKWGQGFLPLHNLSFIIYNKAFSLFFVLLSFSALPCSCFSGRWINATEVVRAQSSFTAGKKIYIYKKVSVRFMWNARSVWKGDKTLWRKTWTLTVSFFLLTVMGLAGLAHTSSLTWCWTAWPKVSHTYAHTHTHSHRL